jgi:hypothetical protein
MEIVKYYNIDTLVNLSTIKFSASEDDTSYITYSNLTSQQGTPDIPWNSVCSIASVNQIYTHGKFYFPGKSGYAGSVYGVQWNTKDPSPECTRIGNMSLHATLPVQSQMVGGTMTDEGVFTEFSNQSDWTSETRDGSIGQVMVRIPRFWWKFETIGDFNRVLMSAVPVIGFKMVPEQYVSAYEASLQRSTNKLSSVVNSDPDFRGGYNQSAWDNEDTAGYNGESHRSLLGRPATRISLTNFRAYARNRKANLTEWNCMTYEIQRALYWLYVVEYATLNSQKAYNAALSTEGYRQGGLGAGVTNWNGNAWNSFNGNNPFIPCGWTDEFGNTTGVKNYVVKNASGSSLLTTSVPRYRGIENPFGHIWKWIDGVLVNVQSNNSGGKSLIYTCYDPVSFSSTLTDNYEYIGDEYRRSTYFTKLTFGSNGDITADSSSVTGSSTSYYCDYHYVNIPSSGTSLRGLPFGGSSYHGAYSGFVASASNRVPSYTHALVGSRLCFKSQSDA